MEELVEYFLFWAERDRERILVFLRFLLDEETVVTFIPLHSSKKKKRGFCQAEILAGHLARISNKKKMVLLERIKDTGLRDGLDRRERYASIRGAFSFIPPKDGLRITKAVLIDDVWFSGSTMNECCRIMKEGGVREIWGFTLTKS